MTGLDDSDMPVAAGSAEPAHVVGDLDDLMQLHGKRFVTGAYRLLLLRDPDDAGVSFYLPRLLDGEPRIQILWELSSSKEARELAADPPGLARAVILYRLSKLPLVGWIIRGLSGTEGNSIFENRLRAVDEMLHEEIRQSEVATRAAIGDMSGLRELVAGSELFDPDWYRDQMPRLDDSVDLLDHFITKGGFEGRSPSKDFDAALYLSRYADVRQSGYNPLVHFLLYGQKEGRWPFTVAEAREFARANSSPVSNYAIHCLKAPEVSGETAVFVSHSPDGHIKPHVIHYIAALRRQGIGVILVIAADGQVRTLADETMSLLGGLFVRENKGFDFAAWAHVLQLHPVIFSAPILYLLNDSVFGPFDDERFAHIVQRIRSSESDVIGLTDSKEHQWHIQSYFLAFKARALASIPFHRFINSISCLGDKDAVIQAYEIQLAPHLRDRGLKVEFLFGLADSIVEPGQDNNTLFRWKELIATGFPFVKVGALSGAFADVDRSDWRQILGREGYDVSLVDRTLELLARPAAIDPGPQGEVGSGAAALLEGPRSPPSRPLRVAFIGPWNFDNGLGFASRGYISALWHTDFLVNVHPIRYPFHVHKRMAPMVDCLSFSGPADVVILHLNPDAWPGLLSDEHRAIISRARKVIGAWVWETQRIPENWYPGFDAVDSIWAPSEYCASVFGKSAKALVEVIPYFIAVRPAATDRIMWQAMRDEIGLTRDQRVILYCFDGASYLVRKNPMGLIAAFEASGLARSGWALVLKTKNLFDLPAQGRRLQDAAQQTPGVILIDKSFDSAMMEILMNLADIYASPHCSEGFGMTIAEAMAIGKIVVATDYGGSRDFVDSSCGYPVTYALHTLTEDHGHYTQGNVWADVDTTALAGALREAAQRIAAGDLSIGAAARERIQANYSSTAIGRSMQRAVAAVLGI